MESTPEVRIRSINFVPPAADRDYVVYWMTAFRRTTYHFGLQRAVEWSNELGKPLVVFDALRCNYRWASDRFHRFLLDGMLDVANRVVQSSASYWTYVEPSVNAGAGLMESIANRACLIVSDDFPCFFHPALFERIAKHWPCRLELVDSNTIVPMRATDRIFTVAHSYRRYMQKVVHERMPSFPVEDPLGGLRQKQNVLPAPNLRKQWGVCEGLKAIETLQKVRLDKLPLDHSVPATDEKGGEAEGKRVLDRFIRSRLATYAEDRNEPEKEGSSQLSPYMHFGQVSPHAFFQAIAKATDWRPEKLSKPNGKMNGFWNIGEHGEAVMDQLMTWREIGFNLCAHDPNYMRYESLPDWAQKTLEEHAQDPRPVVYSLEQFEAAQTHDPLWNAAQNQLVVEGRMHNYLRMLWGKKILHWTESPRQALKVMIELNNKYALDGRDPNSYSGIFWVLGRYDRAWGPERPIFGKIRYMTSESTQSKFSVKGYIKTYAARR